MAVKIPQYQQQTLPQSGGMPRANPAQETGIGQALSEVGDVASRIGEHINAARREADLSDRLGKATAELVDLEFKYENDPDFKTSPQRFQDEAGSIRTKYLGGVGDAAVQQAFGLHFDKLAQAKGINVRKTAFTKERDYNVASLDSSIDLYAKAAATSKNPAEREFVENQARLAIATAQTGGWISQVDAAKRERILLSKTDEAAVLRDMQADPSATADRLATDPEYGANIDPVQRERWADQSYRRAETERVRLEREDEHYRKQRGDELLKDAFAKMDRGKLTREEVEQVKPFVEPSEYRSLLKGLHGGDDQRDDPHAFSDLQRLIYSNPEEAERLAFRYHQNGRIKNSTLSSTLERARNLSRSEGPKSEYERSRSFITTTLAPSAITDDPAPKARMAIALREYDEFAAKGDKKDDDLKKKADEVVKRFSIIDMADLARKTSIGAHSPEAVLESVKTRGQKLKSDYEAKRISESEYRKQMGELNALRQSAERANVK